MDASIFLEISLILVIATLVATAMQFLRQPLIIGHIITGLLVGPYVFNILKSTETIELFSHIGITFLLFVIGLGLNPRVIKEVGKIALITGLGQIIFTTFIGFFVARAIGFSGVPALYIAIALAFSSTIIILKLLSDKKEQHRLYGKIATGFLLVQDMVAALVLIGISSIASGEALPVIATQLLVRGSAFALVLYLLARFVLPRLGSYFARSSEFLFLFSIAWGLGIAALCALLGFSIEIGALVAGVTLASSPYSIEIGARMRPLRDFFIIIFFIVLGTHMAIDNLSVSLLPALLFSAFVLIGNPLIVMALMGFLGYTRKTGFKAGLAVAQISEFSLIVVLLASRVGQIQPEVTSMVTVVALITIAISTYMIIYSDSLYKRLSPFLGVFERKKPRRERNTSSEYDIIMIGFKSGSRSFLQAYQKISQRFLVVDYDPEVIDMLTLEGIDCQYGDANDSEFLEEINIDQARLVVITLTDHATNALVVEHIRHRNSKSVVIAKADEMAEAEILYERGATYVMMPNFLGSVKTSSLVVRNGFTAAKFAGARQKHLSYLHNNAK